MASSVPPSTAFTAAERERGLPPVPGLYDALDTATGHLLSLRLAAGHWAGELSSSALSTATAVAALAIHGRAGGTDFTREIRRGLEWLSSKANADGGWGDTTLSLSNLSTTVLCWAAFGAVPGADEEYQATVRGAERWLARKIGASGTGSREVQQKLAEAVITRYGKDRTFSVPILTMCALCGRLGAGADAWDRVIQLPFEFAALPHQFFAALRLPVVSYALPALIAIGQARHVHRPSANPIARRIRDLTRQRTLKLLHSIQPESGGFLEATPLTGFVLMSLAGSGLSEDPTAVGAVQFLKRSQRKDGSWPIDTNLATWVSTLAVNALPSPVCLGDEGVAQLRSWLLSQQHRVQHPYTHARPGGWAWTDLSGGVPDADDTAGALLALNHLSGKGAVNAPETLAATIAGITWLLRLQNRDGGIPTFCRGWGALPFDRSSPDLTAHAISAWMRWHAQVPARLRQQLNTGLGRAIRYLERRQRPDGAWAPLWFGNQHAPGEQNPLYGTARVLRALAFASRAFPLARPQVERATFWLLKARNPDGGWGGAAAVRSTTEETALAVEALADTVRAGAMPDGSVESVHEALHAGTSWLIDRINSGQWTQPAPLGFYFANLWYWEKLYPVVFTVAALAAVERVAPGGARQIDSG